MTLRIYNTLSRQLETFVPLEPNKVRMYVCGPTVYNFIHIGNARSVVAFDVVRKYLEYRGFEVRYISNFTDVEDKIIRAAREEGVTPTEISERYITAFYEDSDALNVARATENPRATEYIGKMIDFVKVLLDKDFAYVAADGSGDVYFRVAKAQAYAALAGKNLSELIEGASGRATDEETARKENPLDFALWKGVSDGTASGDTSQNTSWNASWQAPWGAGRPGWHLECSVMSTSLLGETLDIHGGGEDLEFPHHTNEIAQSEARTGQHFVNYWMHNGFVNIGGEKMSKSLGNFKTVHEMLVSGQVTPQVLRFFLATMHYRRPLNFTDEALTKAANDVKKIENAYRNLSVERAANLSALTDFRESFIAAMDEDFNIANGLTVFYDFISWVNKGNGGHAVKGFFDEVLQIIGLKFEERTPNAEIDAQVADREKARAARDFARADRIRDELKSRGIILEDTPEGARWHYE